MKIAIAPAWPQILPSPDLNNRLTTDPVEAQQTYVCIFKGLKHNESQIKLSKSSTHFRLLSKITI